LLVSSISYLILKMAFLQDLCIGMLNLFIGRLRPSLLPRLPKKDLIGKTCLITGGNSGIGLSIAKSMAERGCNVYLTSRSVEKGRVAVLEVHEHIMAIPKAVGDAPQVEVVSLDNASFDSVRSLVTDLEQKNAKLDFVFFNAGFPGAAGNNFTDDGHELTYQSNFLSSFLMTHIMLERNMLSDQARIIFTASTGQYGGSFSSDFKSHSTQDVLEPGFHGPPYTKSGLVSVNPSSRYANTKLMQVAFTKLLQRQFDAIATHLPTEKVAPLGSKLMSAHVFTPSYCATPIFGKTDSPSPFNDPLFWFLVVATKIAVPVQEGAATGVWLALKDGIENGGYWDRCEQRTSKADVMSGDMLQKLWDRWCADADVEWPLNKD